MRFYHRLIRSLVLPNNASPNDPRIVIGPDIAPELLAKYGANIVANLLFYRSANQYEFFANTTGGLRAGSVNIALGFTGETWSMTTDGVRSIFRFGDVVGATNYIVDFQPGAGNSQVQFRNAFTIFADGASLRMNPLAVFEIDNGQGFYVKQGRGLVAWGSDTAGTVALAVETVLYNLSANWPNDRTFRHEARMLVRPGGGATAVTFIIRRINIAGGGYVQNLTYPFAAGAFDQMVNVVAYLRNTSGADIVQNMAITVQPTGGVGTVQVIASASTVGSWRITDEGDADDYSGVNTLV